MDFLRNAMAVATLVASSAAASATDIAVRMSSFPAIGKDAPFYLADERGFFADEGIKFTYQSAFSGVIASLVGGSAEIAQDLCSEFVLAIGKGAQIKIIAVRDATYPVGTISLETTDIKSPSDYARRRWATTIGANPEVSAMADLGNLSGFDPNSISIVNVPFNARAAALVAGEVDFVSAWYGSGFPIIASALEKAKVEYRFIKWSEYGLDLYGQCLAARNEWLQNYPATAKGFLKALVRGFQAAKEDPSAAVAATLRANSNSSIPEAIVMIQWKQSIDLLSSEYWDKNGLLQIDPIKIDRIRDIVDIDEKFLGAQIFTNEFLPVDP